VSQVSPVSTTPLPQQGTIGALTHAAVQVPALVSVEVVHALGAVQLVGQAPVWPAAMAVSQVSPVSTTPLPQQLATPVVHVVIGQSASVALVQPAGQQPSLVVPLQVVIGVFTHLAEQSAALPVRAEVVQVSGAVQLVGQAPVCPAGIALSQFSPGSTTPLPQQLATPVVHVVGAPHVTSTDSESVQLTLLTVMVNVFVPVVAHR
jgi:hypothetical protein